MYTFYSCTLMCIHVHWCTLIYTYVHLCSLLFTHVHWCTLICTVSCSLVSSHSIFFTHVYRCTLMFTDVHSHSLMYIHVFWCTLMFNDVPYSVKLWRWKNLTKFDEWSISESLTSKTLTNWVRFLLALAKINYCGIIMCSRRLRTCKFHISVLELASYNNFY